MENLDKMTWQEMKNNSEKLKTFYLSQIESFFDEFENLAKENYEEVIQDYLIEHNFLFDIFSNNSLIFSKHKLADAFIPDFILFGNERWCNSIRPTVTFIEIERADLKLFTSKGIPSSYLTHAINQAQNWKEWLQDNREYFHKQLMKKIEEFSKLSISVEFNDMLLRNLIHGFREQYAIIIGRRSSLTINNRLMLERLNKDYQDIRIITFDTLFTDKLDHNKSVILSSAWTTSDIRKSENAFVVK